jgi:hypothetical protein
MVRTGARRAGRDGRAGVSGGKVGAGAAGRVAGCAGSWIRPGGAARRVTFPPCAARAQVSTAMHYLHRHRITHRDLKPKNILLRSNNRDRRGYVAKVGAAPCPRRNVCILHLTPRPAASPSRPLGSARAARAAAATGLDVCCHVCVWQVSDFGLSQVLDSNKTQVSTKYSGTVTHMVRTRPTLVPRRSRGAPKPAVLCGLGFAGLWGRCVARGRGLTARLVRCAGARAD